MSDLKQGYLRLTRPNNYVEQDLGYQTVAGQHVRVKRVFETPNLKEPSWFVVDKSFRFPVYPS